MKYIYTKKFKSKKEDSYEELVAGLGKGNGLEQLN